MRKFFTIVFFILFILVEIIISFNIFMIKQKYPANLSILIMYEVLGIACLIIANSFNRFDSWQRNTSVTLIISSILNYVILGLLLLVINSELPWQFGREEAKAISAFTNEIIIILTTQSTFLITGIILLKNYIRKT